MIAAQRRTQDSAPAEENSAVQGWQTCHVIAGERSIECRRNALILIFEISQGDGFYSLSIGNKSAIKNGQYQVIYSLSPLLEVIIEYYSLIYILQFMLFFLTYVKAIFCFFNFIDKSLS